MAHTETVINDQSTSRESSHKDADTDNATNGHIKHVETRTLKSNNRDNDVPIDDDEEDEESNVDISKRLGEFAQANNESNGFAAMSGAGDGERQSFVHSYSISTSSWRSWAKRVAATSNIEVVLRNISLLHGMCSVLLIFMGILGVVTQSYMSYLAITIWSPIFFFLPTSFSGLQTHRRLRNHSLIQRLTIFTTLSTVLSTILCIVFIFFIFRDGQLKSDCKPSPSLVLSDCRISVYRVLINAVIVFLFIMELIASSSTLIVCFIIKPGSAKKSSDTEQLISRTSMSYKRLAAADESVEELSSRDPLTNNNSSSMYSRSVSAPAIVGLSTTRPYFD